jgi:protein-S-isoprenylcysteine O-methyltransferase Ste14
MIMNDNTSVQQEMTPELRRGVVRWLIREVIGVLFVAATLFIPAGRWNWVWGWALVVIYAVWVSANALILIPRSPELLAERAQRKKGIKDWDAVLMSIVGILTLCKHIVAGLDARYGWTVGIPLWLQIVTLVIAVLGYALGTWAMAANAFFSQLVRIQDDRGHAVVTGGPYQFVRHPGYVGVIAFELATPVMLGSLWALIAGVLAALLVVVRTALEDRTLQKELEGYGEYTQQTRYRLLPGVW